MKRMIEEIKKFRDERGWMKYHKPKDMAISVAIEAAELLEHFQWKNEKEASRHIEKCRGEIADEIADVAMYLFELADNLGIDLAAAMKEKLRKNRMKYPV
jgi:NTP pyrophosphatase (non-canonical NTP hydrolase)